MTKSLWRALSLLTLAAYQESGGVLGALARRAETLFSGLDDDGRQAAQQLFLRLVEQCPAAPFDQGQVVLRRALIFEVFQHHAGQINIAEYVT